MKIRDRAIVIILISTLFLIGTIYFVSQAFLIRNAKVQERQIVVTETSRTMNLFSGFIKNLEATVGDWAPWDDTYYFIENLNEDYIESNLNSATIGNLGLNIILFYDNDKNIKYSRGYNINKGEFEELPQNLYKYIEENKGKIFDFEELDSVNSGFVSIDKDIMIIAAAPITNSEFQAEANGTLIFGKYINEDIISEIESTSSGRINLFGGDKSDIKENGTELVNEEYLAYIDVEPIDKNLIEVRVKIRDITGDPSISMKFVLERSLYKQAKRALDFFITVSVIIIFIISLISYLFIQRFLITPILKLRVAIHKIDLNKGSFDKINFTGKDEISGLTNSINRMLSKIEKDNIQISENEKQLKLVLESANAGYWDMDVEKNTIFINYKLNGFLGYEEKDSIETIDWWNEQINAEDIKQAAEKQNISFDNMIANLSCQMRVLTKSGKYKWFFSNSSIVEFDEMNKPKRLVGILMDIEESKQVEEELRYITYHDKLTGLYNRIYFDYVLQIKNLMGKFPMSIVMVDINGLKEINDIYGQAEGDKIIIGLSKILTGICSDSDIVCRWGGDDFIIIFENMDEKAAEEVYEKIRLQSLNENFSEVSFNISIGYATKTNLDQRIEDIVKLAEERMHRNKLFEIKSVRGSIVISLERTLLEKSFETEEHTKRMYELCRKIGMKLNMPNALVDELTLLARLHDIGKTAIRDSILNKPGKLNDEEWEIMKTHCEIGYRIASSAPELKHIANAILSHHEKFDGTGYPNGLKGKDIPYISRILAIVDAFDVMTNDRPYKKAVSKSEAIKELKRCSGTQFDPDLVEVCLEILEEEE